jgi:hypothetical protein
MPTQKLTNEIITAAIQGFESQKTYLDGKIAELRAMLDGSAESATSPEATPGKRRKFSVASRKKMALAQKARWAKIKGQSEPAQPAATPATPKRKRRMSKEGRARIVAATKARWARVRAEKEAAAKKSTAGKKATRKTTAKKAGAPATTQAAG